MAKMSTYTLAFDRRFGKWSYPVHAWVYKRTGGIVGRWSPMGPMCLLTTTGRKSGLPRTTPLLCVPDGDLIYVVASNGARDTPPAWLGNLRADPHVLVQLGRTHLRMVAEVLTGDDKAAVWPQLVAQYHGWDDYQQLTDREIPVVRLRPETADQA